MDYRESNLSHLDLMARNVFYPTETWIPDRIENIYQDYCEEHFFNWNDTKKFLPGFNGEENILYNLEPG